VKVYVIWSKYNPTYTVPDGTLWVVEVQYTFWQMWRSLISGFVYNVLPQTQDMQEMGSK